MMTTLDLTVRFGPAQVRDLERLVLRRVLDEEGGPEVRFVGRYVPAERNGPCGRLYAEARFRACLRWHVDCCTRGSTPG